MSLSDISQHFTEATLDEIVRKAGATRHTSFEFGEGFKKGDSYLSKVFRISINGINEKTSKSVKVNLIVKSIPDNAARRKLFRSTEFFRNEINFYTKVLPIWEDFQLRRKAKNPFVEYPKCYAYYSDGLNDFIALEDISFSGYAPISRAQTLTFKETALIMRSLGRFHGISLALHALEPETFELTASNVEETYYSEKYRDWYLPFLGLACNISKDAVTKTCPNSKYDKITNKFLQPAELFDDLCHLVTAKSNLRAISHGDCWSPNFLSTTDQNGEPEKAKIIDFQLSRCASLALDIMFFTYSCTDQQLRENHFEQLLKEYHSAACDLINDLGADAEKVFTFQALLNELREFGRFGCGMGIESLATSQAEDDELIDLDDITENNVLLDVWNFKPYTDQTKRERVAAMFKHAIDQNYLV